ncbi:hypothetical protein HPB48_015678 [Haemaphysalis longicornis]|uniref:Uncharacterized protein n=1 Tax=Haemaphysalis longicornis TaxID=44386 RepID=A0A9J6G978_HAELO|nr:hypothetical protein HPB48_015678 [Haemaphysalis longicornis]
MNMKHCKLYLMTKAPVTHSAGEEAGKEERVTAKFSGFVFGKVKLVKGREVRALDLLASHVCLSALLFLNLSQLRLRAVEWRLVGAVLLGKVSLFIVVAAVTLALSPRRHQKGDLASAGLYAIFVTQVNHFGIAYPLVESVFGRSHPSFAGYIYLVAPLSLVLLNPVGLFLIEHDDADP